MSVAHVAQLLAVARRLIKEHKNGEQSPFFICLKSHYLAYGKLKLMRVTILYHPNSEQARSVEDFVHDIEAQQGIKSELLSLDTREGAAMATLYDITRYPAIVVSREDGGVIQTWSGEQLPLMNEVAAYAR